MLGDDEGFEDDLDGSVDGHQRSSPNNMAPDFDDNDDDGGSQPAFSPEPLTDVQPKQDFGFPSFGQAALNQTTPRGGGFGGFGGGGYASGGFAGFGADPGGRSSRGDDAGSLAGNEEPPLSPVESRNRWEQKTIEGLNQAKALTRQALRNTADNDSTHSKTHRSNHSNSAGVSNTIKKKIGVTEDLIKAIEDRIESVGDTVRQVGECLFQLQRAHRSKWAPLNVCERRLELRAARPLQELIRDSCQEALEHERQTMVEARQELADQIDALKQMLIALDKIQDDLVHDLQHKRHGLRIDRSCLSTKKLSNDRVAKQERLVLPSLHEVTHYGSPPSPKDTKAGSGHSQEEGRQDETRALIARAVNQEEAAMQMCNESDAAMIHTKRECARAASQAQTELQRRIEETHSLRKQLEAQIHETDDAIVQTETSLATTRKKLDLQDAPLRALDKQFAMRGSRTSREGIRDPVHEEMEGHLDSLKKNVRTLTEKWQTTKDILDQLKSAKQSLQADYRYKLAAQKIDDACAKVTPRKAIELDRMDPRAGRCRPSSRKKHAREYKATFADGGWAVMR